MRRSTGRSPWSRRTRRAPGGARPTGGAPPGVPRPFGGRHRRRPGGPGRYSAAAVRACRVIDAGCPRRGSACHETQKGTGRGCTPGSCFVCTAFRRHEPPYWGVQGGRSPPGPSFSPFLREEMRAPAAQACHPGGTPANNGGGKPPPYSAWQFPRQPGFYQTGDHRSPLRTVRRVVAPHGASGCGGKRAARRVVPHRWGARRAGIREPLIRPSARTGAPSPQRGEGSGRAMRAPRGHARFRTKKRAARDTGGACVYRSSRKYAKPRLAGGCLSRLLRREVKISTTTVTT